MPEQIYIVRDGGAYSWDVKSGLRYLHYVDPAQFGAGANGFRGGIDLADVDRDGRAEAVYRTGDAALTIVDYDLAGAPSLRSLTLPQPDSFPSTGLRIGNEMEGTVGAFDGLIVEYRQAGVNHGTAVSYSTYRQVNPATGEQANFYSRFDSAFITGERLIAVGEFTGDLVPDLIYSPSNAQGSPSELMLRSGGGRSGEFINLGPGTSIAGVGNFSGGTAREEVLLFDSANRQLILWDPAKQSQGFTPLFPLGEGWAVAGTGDLTGDGIDDILVNYRTPAGAQPTTTPGNTVYFDPVNKAFGFVGIFDRFELRDIAPVLTAASKPQGAERLVLYRADGIYTWKVGDAAATYNHHIDGSRFNGGTAADIDGDGRGEVVYALRPSGGDGYRYIAGSLSTLPGQDRITNFTTIAAPVQGDPGIFAPEQFALRSAGDLGGGAGDELVLHRTQARSTTGSGSLSIVSATVESLDPLSGSRNVLVPSLASSAFAVGDFDGQGTDDLVYFGDGGARLRTAAGDRIIAAGSVLPITAGNFTAGNVTDEILLFDQGTSRFRLYDPASGTFSDPRGFTPGDGWIFGAVGDLTGDGFDEVVYTTPQGGVRYWDPVAGRTTQVAALADFQVVAVGLPGEPG
ncbi:MAG TPA: hypothetical protein VED40_19470 [Azospirillaceae bacterium]|nr:hypothetical protein [Azospirillaceae bacterium]